MLGAMAMKKYEAVIIGGGQAGLAMGYFFKKEKIPFVIMKKTAVLGTPGDKDIIPLFYLLRADIAVCPDCK